ncbi:MAG: hypothetical protein IJH34_04550, partial [Romboutsia sp.]|nr:hypothetical protein [Romboutsia sp.]
SFSIYVLGITAIIPLSYFVEGFLCFLNKKSFLIPLLISIIIFSLCASIELKSDIYAYIIYYVLSYLLGVILAACYLRLKNFKQKRKKEKHP